MAIRGAVKAPNPLAVAELTFMLRNLIFPKAGEYRFQLWSEGTFLGERKLRVEPMPAKGDPPSAST